MGFGRPSTHPGAPEDANRSSGRVEETDGCQSGLSPAADGGEHRLGVIGYLTGLAPLVNYPALLAVGLGLLAANATNTVAGVGAGIGTFLQEHVPERISRWVISLDGFHLAWSLLP